MNIREAIPISIKNMSKIKFVNEDTILFENNKLYSGDNVGMNVIELKENLNASFGSGNILGRLIELLPADENFNFEYNSEQKKFIISNDKRKYVIPAKDPANFIKFEANLKQNADVEITKNVLMSLLEVSWATDKKSVGTVNLSSVCLEFHKFGAVGIATNGFIIAKKIIGEVNEDVKRVILDYQHVETLKNILKASISENVKIIVSDKIFTAIVDDLSFSCATLQTKYYNVDSYKYDGGFKVKIKDLEMFKRALDLAISQEDKEKTRAKLSIKQDKVIVSKFRLDEEEEESPYLIEIPAQSKKEIEIGIYKGELLKVVKEYLQNQKEMIFRVEQYKPLIFDEPFNEAGGYIINQIAKL